MIEPAANMMIFLDTEFTDFIDCELISIGMISEDGQHQFYAERNDFRKTRCSPFVRSEVLPLIGQDGALQLSRHKLHRALWKWFSELPCAVQIGCDYSGDWELLCDALIDYAQTSLPAGITGRVDLNSYLSDPAYELALRRFYNPDRPPHHALYDAMARRAGWLAIREE